MQIEKKEVLKMLRSFPKNVDVDEFIYRLYIRKRIAQGEEDIRHGRVFSHERVLQKVSKWFQKSKREKKKVAPKAA